MPAYYIEQKQGNLPPKQPVGPNRATAPMPTRGITATRYADTGSHGRHQSKAEVHVPMEDMTAALCQTCMTPATHELKIEDWEEGREQVPTCLHQAILLFKAERSLLIQNRSYPVSKVLGKDYAPRCTALLGSFIADNEAYKREVAGKNTLHRRMPGERQRRLLHSTVQQRGRDGDRNCAVLYRGIQGESAPVEGDAVRGGKIAILWRAHEGG